MNIEYIRYHIYISVTHCIQKQKISSKYPVPWMHIELILKWDRNHNEKLEYKNDELHKSLLIFICGKKLNLIKMLSMMSI